MKKIITLGAMAMVLCATSCSTDETVSNDVNNEGKEKIQFAAGDNQVLTSRAGFKESTKIVARIVSDKRDGSETKCVKTVLSAASGAQDADGFSNVSYAEGKTRYWDDAHGRYSRLSVYAVAIPNVSDVSESAKLKEASLKGGDTWATTDATDNKIAWSVNTAPAYADLAAEDLTYSNNIQNGNVGGNGVYTWNYSTKNYPEIKPSNATKHTYGSPAVTDGRMYFTQEGKNVDEAVTDAPGHFDKGQLEFKHALTRIQVNLLKGDGYGSDATFAVSEMKVLGQSVSGTFDIQSATWSDKTAATPIAMAKWASAATRTDGKTNAATYEAQMLPDYTFADNTTNALQLTVDGNTYFITNAQLRTALNGKVPTDDYATKMGNRYVFDITVAKAKIQNITATIIDWNEVNAANTTVDNSHVKFNFYNGGEECADINLYKYMQTLDKIYTDGSYTANPVAGSAYTEVAGLDVATGMTSEFYNDNQTAYHFRSINNAAEAVLNSGKTAFTMTSGATDYHWGAPMKTGLTSDKLPYDLSKGYLSSIAKGIVAADKESTINLTEVHMMSKLVVKLTTPETGAKVNLEGATVTLTKFSKTGTVDMGSALVTPATTYEDLALTYNSTDKQYELNVVPQALVRGSSDDDYVGITIHTTDNNEYYVVKKLSDIIATSVGTQVTNLQTKDDAITTWYPGHKYIYTFNITKTEIKNITATIVNWNEVVAGNTDLDLEK